MKVLSGDLIQLAKEGMFDVIIHGCNCFHKMQAGIALKISEIWPAVIQADRTTKFGDINKLGTYSVAKVMVEGKDLYIVNAYTQFKYGRDRQYLEYPALANVMRLIKRDFSGLRIGYPMIGAGLAGGDWNLISQIINAELKGEDHTLVTLIQKGPTHE